MDILNIIMSALSVGLDALFPVIPIYPELVPQKLPSRCFLIGFAGETQIAREITDRYKVSGKLDITYLAPQKQDEPETRRELNAVSATLALNLGIIRSGGVSLRLHSHTITQTDDELHDVCSFILYLQRVDDTPFITNTSIDKEELK